MSMIPQSWGKIANNDRKNPVSYYILMKIKTCQVRVVLKYRSFFHLWSEEPKCLPKIITLSKIDREHIVRSLCKLSIAGLSN